MGVVGDGHERLTAGPVARTAPGVEVEVVAGVAVVWEVAVKGGGEVALAPPATGLLGDGDDTATDDDDDDDDDEVGLVGAGAWLSLSEARMAMLSKASSSAIRLM